METINNYWLLDAKANPNTMSNSGIPFSLVIKVPEMNSDKAEKLYIMDWCHRTFGSSVLFTKYGPTEKYELFKSTKQLYDNKVASHIKLFGEAKIVNEKMDIDIVAMNDVDKGYKETKDMSTYELCVMHEIMNRK